MIYPSVITLNLLLEVITNETISNIVINTNPHAVHINPLAHLLSSSHDSIVGL